MMDLRPKLCKSFPFCFIVTDFFLPKLSILIFITGQSTQSWHRLAIRLHVLRVIRSIMAIIRYTRVLYNHPSFCLLYLPTLASVYPLGMLLQMLFRKCPYVIVTWRLKAAVCPSAGRGFTEHVPVETQWCLCWTVNCWNMFPQQRIQLKKQCIAYRVTSIPRQHIQKHSRSHGNEPPKHSNSKECDNSTVEGGDLHTVRPKPTSGRELTNRRQKTNRSQVFILCDVVKVTFRVLL
jgi:hypothetical protein